MMETLVVYWLCDGIRIIKQDRDELANLVPLNVTNLWDVRRSNYLIDDILPRIHKKIRMHEKELYALMCTSKTAYINGHPKIEDNIQ